MKKVFRFILFTGILTAILFSIATPGLAQDVTPPTPTQPAAVPPIESGYVPFYAMDGEAGGADTRAADIVLRGPYSGADVRFTLPSSWSLEPPASLTLVLTAAFSELETVGGRSAGANLAVTMNDVTIASIFITEEGQQVYDIPIPLSALVTSRLDGRHVIDFSLDAAFDCEFPHETIIIISSTSALRLSHTLKPATADLTILPRPFYQQNSFLPEEVRLVIPNMPTADELQAALTVSAAFGRMSAGNLDLALTRAEELTEEARLNSHLIFVGASGDLQGLIQQVQFPPAQALEGDGILQVAVSPWNQSRVVMQVTGTDEAGLLKAAQALTFGTIQPVNNVQTAVIREVNPTNGEQLVADVRSFINLGYPTRTVNGFGLSTLEYRFYLPPGFVAGATPHLNLIYGHSALLDFGNSGVVISLNDQLISSFEMAAETATQLNTIKIPLYADALRPGDNRLLIQADLLPENICSTFSDRGVWFTVVSDSTLNIPLVPAEPGNATALANLSQFPYPFNSDPSLGNVGFVLSKDDTKSWTIAAKFASQLGRRATGQLITPQMAFVDTLTDDFLGNHLIVIGEPARLPLLAQIADSMPAPFEAGSNIVTERTLTVEYRLPTEASLGYIELFQSPWDVERMILTVLGSTAEGLDWAYNAMTVSSLRGRVTGNFVVVNNTQVISTDTRISSRTIVPNTQPVLPAAATESSPITPTPAATRMPGWILPTIIAISVLIIGLILFLAVRAIRQSKIER